MIVVDTSFLYALLDRRDGRHEESATWYAGQRGDFVTTPLVLAELDHLADSRVGAVATAAVRRDVEAGAYGIEWWPSAGVDAARISEEYADARIGLTDASLVALADRVDTVTIATFDDRHFRLVRPLNRATAFTLMPLDA